MFCFHVLLGCVGVLGLAAGAILRDECLEDEFDCGGEEWGVCIRKEQECDTGKDCPYTRWGHADEHEGCPDTTECKGDNQWKCPDDQGKCISKLFVCDSLDRDCGYSNEDEWGQNCSSTCTGPNQWRCPGEDTCIPIVSLCDSFNDCEGGEDELGCDQRVNVTWVL